MIQLRTPRLVCALLVLVGVLITVGCGSTPTTFPAPEQVAAGDALPIDGSWQLESNGVVFQIDAGRVWATEPYKVLLSLVQPNQVLVRDLRQVTSQRFVGYDMFLKAEWRAHLRDDGSLAVTIATAVPISLVYNAVEIADPAWLEAQLRSVEIVGRPGDRATVPLAAPIAAVPAEPSSPTTPAVPQTTGTSFGEYHALVIGNNDYNHFDRLQTARNDAQAVADLLREEYGFTVQLILDATR
jgi:hypothetical protein